MEKEIKAMTDEVLLMEFASCVIKITDKIKTKNITDTVDIPTFPKDFLSLHLIEVLRRMGRTPEEIKDILRKFPLLQYKDGEEEYFLI